jgi:hypothetical protein
MTSVSLKFGQIMWAWVLSHLLGTFMPKNSPTPPLMHASAPVQTVTLEAAVERLREAKLENEAMRARLEAVAREITPTPPPAPTVVITETTKTETSASPQLK